MQIISTLALYNYKVRVITKTTSHSVLENHGKTLKTFFQDFPGLINEIQGLSRTAKKIQDFPGLFQNVATLDLV